MGSKCFSKAGWAEHLKQSGFEAQAMKNCTPKIADTLIRYCTSHAHTSNSLLKCFLFERKLVTISKGCNHLLSVFSCYLLQWCRQVMLPWQPSCPSWPFKCRGFTTLISTWMREAFGTQASVLHSELPGAQGHGSLLGIKISSSSLLLPSSLSEYKFLYFPFLIYFLSKCIYECVRRHVCQVRQMKCFYTMAHLSWQL